MMINWQIGKLKFWLKLTAFFVAVLFTWNTLAWADGAGNILLSLKNPAKNSPSLESFIRTIQIPSEIGQIKRIYQGNRNELIVHIQDAHVNEEAQRNIAAIIDHFAENHKTRLVNVEGASGELAHHLLSVFPDQKARRLVADYFLNEALVTGPEYLALQKRADLILNGVEDAKLYHSNRQAFLEALEFKAQDEQIIQRLRKMLEAVGHHVLSKELWDLIRHEQEFQKETLDLVSYLQYLAGQAQQLQITQKFPQMEAFQKLLALEKHANKDQNPEYLELSKSIGIEIFDEIKQLEGLLKEKLFKNGDDRMLDRLFKYLGIYEKIFDFALTKEDAEFFYQHRNEFKSETFRNFLWPLLEKYHFDQEIKNLSLKSLDEDLPKIEAFYESALKRDDILISNALKKMIEGRQNTAVLVTGGFHTPGIEKKLRELGYSYLVVTPRISKEIDQVKESERYAKAMRSEPTRLAKLLTEAYFPALSGRANDPRYQLGAPTELPTYEILTSLKLNTENGLINPRNLIQQYPSLDLVVTGALLLALVAAVKGKELKALGEMLSQMAGFLQPQEKSLADALYAPILAGTRQESGTSGSIVGKVFGDGASLTAVWRSKKDYPEVTTRQKGAVFEIDGFILEIRLEKGGVAIDLVQPRKAQEDLTEETSTHPFTLLINDPWLEEKIRAEVLSTLNPEERKGRLLAWTLAALALHHREIRTTAKQKNIYRENLKNAVETYDTFQRIAQATPEENLQKVSEMYLPKILTLVESKQINGEKTNPEILRAAYKELFDKEKGFVREIRAKGSDKVWAAFSTYLATQGLELPSEVRSEVRSPEEFKKIQDRIKRARQRVDQATGKEKEKQVKDIQILLSQIHKREQEIREKISNAQKTKLDNIYRVGEFAEVIGSFDAEIETWQTKVREENVPLATYFNEASILAAFEASERNILKDYEMLATWYEGLVQAVIQKEVEDQALIEKSWQAFDTEQKAIIEKQSIAEYKDQIKESKAIRRFVHQRKQVEQAFDAYKSAQEKEYEARQRAEREAERKRKVEIDEAFWAKEDAAEDEARQNLGYALFEYHEMLEVLKEEETLKAKPKKAPAKVKAVSPEKKKSKQKSIVSKIVETVPRFKKLTPAELTFAVEVLRNGSTGGFFALASQVIFEQFTPRKAEPSEPEPDYIISAFNVLADISLTAPSFQKAIQAPVAESKTLEVSYPVVEETPLDLSVSSDVVIPSLYDAVLQENNELRQRIEDLERQLRESKESQPSIIVPEAPAETLAVEVPPQLEAASAQAPPVSEVVQLKAQPAAETVVTPAIEEAPAQVPTPVEEASETVALDSQVSDETVVTTSEPAKAAPVAEAPAAQPLAEETSLLPTHEELENIKKERDEYLLRVNQLGDRIAQLEALVLELRAKLKEKVVREETLKTLREKGASEEVTVLVTETFDKLEEARRQTGEKRDQAVEAARTTLIQTVEILIEMQAKGQITAQNQELTQVINPLFTEIEKFKKSQTLDEIAKQVADLNEAQQTLAAQLETQTLTDAARQKVEELEQTEGRLKKQISDLEIESAEEADVESYARTEPGMDPETKEKKSEDQNEDSSFSLIHVTPTAHLLMVADGMGGHKDGRMASQLAIQKLRESISPQSIQEAEKKVQELKVKGTTAASFLMELALIPAMKEADRAVGEALEGKGGTTLAEILLWLSPVDRQWHAVGVSAGDSYIVLVRNHPQEGQKKVEILNRSDGMLETLARQGMDPNQLKHMKGRSTILDYLGNHKRKENFPNEEDFPARHQRINQSVLPGDSIFLFSDGIEAIWQKQGFLSNEEIENLLEGIFQKTTTVKEAVDGLFDLANEAADKKGGYYDDKTIEAIAVPSIPSLPVTEKSVEAPVQKFSLEESLRLELEALWQSYVDRILAVSDTYLKRGKKVDVKVELAKKFGYSTKGRGADPLFTALGDFAEKRNKLFQKIETQLQDPKIVNNLKLEFLKLEDGFLTGEVQEDGEVLIPEMGTDKVQDVILTSLKDQINELEAEKIRLNQKPAQRAERIDLSETPKGEPVPEATQPTPVTKKPAEAELKLKQLWRKQPERPSVMKKLGASISSLFGKLATGGYAAGSGLWSVMKMLAQRVSARVKIILQERKLRKDKVTQTPKSHSIIELTTSDADIKLPSPEESFNQELEDLWIVFAKPVQEVNNEYLTSGKNYNVKRAFRGKFDFSLIVEDPLLEALNALENKRDEIFTRMENELKDPQKIIALKLGFVEREEKFLLGYAEPSEIGIVPGILTNAVDDTILKKLAEDIRKLKEEKIKLNRKPAQQTTKVPLKEIRQELAKKSARVSELVDLSETPQAETEPTAPAPQPAVKTPRTPEEITAERIRIQNEAAEETNLDKLDEYLKQLEELSEELDQLQARSELREKTTRVSVKERFQKLQEQSRRVDQALQSFERRIRKEKKAIEVAKAQIVIKKTRIGVEQNLNEIVDGLYEVAHQPVHERDPSRIANYRARNASIDREIDPEKLMSGYPLITEEDSEIRPMLDYLYDLVEEKRTAINHWLVELEKTARPKATMEQVAEESAPKVAQPKFEPPSRNWFTHLLFNSELPFWKFVNGRDSTAWAQVISVLFIVAGPVLISVVRELSDSLVWVGTGLLLFGVVGLKFLKERETDTIVSAPKKLPFQADHQVEAFVQKFHHQTLPRILTRIEKSSKKIKAFSAYVSLASVLEMVHPRFVKEVRGKLENLGVDGKVIARFLKRWDVVELEDQPLSEPWWNAFRLMSRELEKAQFAIDQVVEELSLLSPKADKVLGDGLFVGGLSFLVGVTAFIYLQFHSSIEPTMHFVWGILGTGWLTFTASQLFEIKDFIAWKKSFPSFTSLSRSEIRMSAKDRFKQQIQAQSRELDQAFERAIQASKKGIEIAKAEIFIKKTRFKVESNLDTIIVGLQKIAEQTKEERDGSEISKFRTQNAGVDPQIDPEKLISDFPLVSIDDLEIDQALNTLLDRVESKRNQILTLFAQIENGTLSASAQKSQKSKPASALPVDTKAVQAPQPAPEAEVKPEPQKVESAKKTQKTKTSILGSAWRAVKSLTVQKTFAAQAKQLIRQTGTRIASSIQWAVSHPDVGVPQLELAVIFTGGFVLFTYTSGLVATVVYNFLLSQFAGVFLVPWLAVVFTGFFLFVLSLGTVEFGLAVLKLAGQGIFAAYLGVHPKARQKRDDEFEKIMNGQKEPLAEALQLSSPFVSSQELVAYIVQHGSNAKTLDKIAKESGYRHILDVPRLVLWTVVRQMEKQNQMRHIKKHDYEKAEKKKDLKLGPHVLEAIKKIKEEEKLEKMSLVKKEFWMALRLGIKSWARVRFTHVSDRLQKGVSFLRLPRTAGVILQLAIDILLLPWHLMESFLLGNYIPRMSYRYWNRPNHLTSKDIERLVKLYVNKTPKTKAGKAVEVEERTIVGRAKAAARTSIETARYLIWDQSTITQGTASFINRRAYLRVLGFLGMGLIALIGWFSSTALGFAPLAALGITGLAFFTVQAYISSLATVTGLYLPKEVEKEQNRLIVEGWKDKLRAPKYQQLSKESKQNLGSTIAARLQDPQFFDYVAKFRDSLEERSQNDKTLALEFLSENLLPLVHLRKLNLSHEAEYQELEHVLPDKTGPPSRKERIKRTLVKFPLIGAPLRWLFSPYQWRSFKNTALSTESSIFWAKMLFVSAPGMSLLLPLEIKGMILAGEALDQGIDFATAYSLGRVSADEQGVLDASAGEETIAGKLKAITMTSMADGRLTLEEKDLLGKIMEGKNHEEIKALLLAGQLEQAAARFDQILQEEANRLRFFHSAVSMVEIEALEIANDVEQAVLQTVSQIRQASPESTVTSLGERDMRFLMGFYQTAPHLIMAEMIGGSVKERNVPQRNPAQDDAALRTLALANLFPGTDTRPSEDQRPFVTPKREMVRESKGEVKEEGSIEPGQSRGSAKPDAVREEGKLADSARGTVKPAPPGTVQPGEARGAPWYIEKGEAKDKLRQTAPREVPYFPSPQLGGAGQVNPSFFMQNFIFNQNGITDFEISGRLNQPGASIQFSRVAFQQTNGEVVSRPTLIVVDSVTDPEFIQKRLPQLREYWKHLGSLGLQIMIMDSGKKQEPERLPMPKEVIPELTDEELETMHKKAEKQKEFGDEAGKLLLERIKPFSPEAIEQLRILANGSSSFKKLDQTLESRYRGSLGLYRYLSTTPYGVYLDYEGKTYRVSGSNVYWTETRNGQLLNYRQSVDQFFSNQLRIYPNYYERLRFLDKEGLKIYNTDIRGKDIDALKNFKYLETDSRGSVYFEDAVGKKYSAFRGIIYQFDHEWKKSKALSPIYSFISSAIAAQPRAPQSADSAYWFFDRLTEQNPVETDRLQIAQFSPYFRDLTAPTNALRGFEYLRTGNDGEVFFTDSHGRTYSVHRGLVYLYTNVQKSEYYGLGPLYDFLRSKADETPETHLSDDPKLIKGRDLLLDQMAKFAPQEIQQIKEHIQALSLRSAGLPGYKYLMTDDHGVIFEDNSGRIIRTDENFVYVPEKTQAGTPHKKIPLNEFFNPEQQAQWRFLYDEGRKIYRQYVLNQKLVGLTNFVYDHSQDGKIFFTDQISHRTYWIQGGFVFRESRLESGAKKLEKTPIAEFFSGRIEDRTYRTPQNPPLQHITANVDAALSSILSQADLVSVYINGSRVPSNLGQGVTYERVVKDAQSKGQNATILARVNGEIKIYLVSKAGVYPNPLPAEPQVSAPSRTLLGILRDQAKKDDKEVEVIATPERGRNQPPTTTLSVDGVPVLSDAEGVRWVEKVLKSHGYDVHTVAFRAALDPARWAIFVNGRSLETWLKEEAMSPREVQRPEVAGAGGDRLKKAVDQVIIQQGIDIPVIYDSAGTLSQSLRATGTAVLPAGNFIVVRNGEGLPRWSDLLRLLQYPHQSGQQAQNSKIVLRGLDPIVRAHLNQELSLNQLIEVWEQEPSPEREKILQDDIVDTESIGPHPVDIDKLPNEFQHLKNIYARLEKGRLPGDEGPFTRFVKSLPPAFLEKSPFKTPEDWFYYMFSDIPGLRQATPEEIEANVNTLIEEVIPDLNKIYNNIDREIKKNRAKNGIKEEKNFRLDQFFFTYRRERAQSLIAIPPDLVNVRYEPTIWRQKMLGFLEIAWEDSRGTEDARISFADFWGTARQRMMEGSSRNLRNHFGRVSGEPKFPEDWEKLHIANGRAFVNRISVSPTFWRLHEEIYLLARGKSGLVDVPPVNEGGLMSSIQDGTGSDRTIRRYRDGRLFDTEHYRNGREIGAPSKERFPYRGPSDRPIYTLRDLLYKNYNPDLLSRYPENAGFELGRLSSLRAHKHDERPNIGYDWVIKDIHDKVTQEYDRIRRHDWRNGPPVSYVISPELDYWVSREGYLGYFLRNPQLNLEHAPLFREWVNIYLNPYHIEKMAYDPVYKKQYEMYQEALIKTGLDVVYAQWLQKILLTDYFYRRSKLLIQVTQAEKRLQEQKWAVEDIRYWLRTNWNVFSRRSLTEEEQKNYGNRLIGLHNQMQATVQDLNQSKGELAVLEGADPQLVEERKNLENQLSYISNLIKTISLNIVANRDDFMFRDINQGLDQIGLPRITSAPDTQIIEEALQQITNPEVRRLIRQRFDVDLHLQLTKQLPNHFFDRGNFPDRLRNEKNFLPFYLAALGHLLDDNRFGNADLERLTRLARKMEEPRGVLPNLPMEEGPKEYRLIGGRPHPFYALTPYDYLRLPEAGPRFLVESLFGQNEESRAQLETLNRYVQNELSRAYGGSAPFVFRVQNARDPGASSTATGNEKDDLKASYLRDSNLPEMNSLVRVTGYDILDKFNLRTLADYYLYTFILNRSLWANPNATDPREIFGSDLTRAKTKISQFINDDKALQEAKVFEILFTRDFNRTGLMDLFITPVLNGKINEKISLDGGTPELKGSGFIIKDYDYVRKVEEAWVNLLLNDSGKKKFTRGENDTPQDMKRRIESMTREDFTDALPPHLTHEFLLVFSLKYDHLLKDDPREREMVEMIYYRAFLDRSSDLIRRIYANTIFVWLADAYQTGFHDTAEIVQVLKLRASMRPAVETLIGRPLRMTDPDDAGLLSAVSDYLYRNKIDPGLWVTVLGVASKPEVRAKALKLYRLLSDSDLEEFDLVSPRSRSQHTGFLISIAIDILDMKVEKFDAFVKVLEDLKKENPKFMDEVLSVTRDLRNGINGIFDPTRPKIQPEGDNFEKRDSKSRGDIMALLKAAVEREDIKTGFREEMDRARYIANRLQSEELKNTEKRQVVLKLAQDFNNLVFSIFPKYKPLTLTDREIMRNPKALDAFINFLGGAFEPANRILMNPNATDKQRAEAEERLFQKWKESSSETIQYYMQDAALARLETEVEGKFKKLEDMIRREIAMSEAKKPRGERLLTSDEIDRNIEAQVKQRIQPLLTSRERSQVAQFDTVREQINALRGPEEPKLPEFKNLMRLEQLSREERREAFANYRQFVRGELLSRSLARVWLDMNRPVSRDLPPFLNLYAFEDTNNRQISRAERIESIESFNRFVNGVDKSPFRKGTYIRYVVDFVPKARSEVRRDEKINRLAPDGLFPALEAKDEVADRRVQILSAQLAKMHGVDTPSPASLVSQKSLMIVEWMPYMNTRTVRDIQNLLRAYPNLHIAVSLSNTSTGNPVLSKLTDLAKGDKRLHVAYENLTLTTAQMIQQLGLSRAGLRQFALDESAVHPARGISAVEIDERVATALNTAVRLTEEVSVFGQTPVPYATSYIPITLEELVNTWRTASEADKKRLSSA